MKPFDLDLRYRVLDIPPNVSSSSVGARFDVSASFVRKYRQRVREGGDIEPSPIPGRPSKINSENEKLLQAIVKKSPDSTLPQIAAFYEESTGIFD
jgi:transposase